MPKITNCLWFDREAEAAAELYVSLFPNSRLVSVGRYPEGLPGDRAGEGAAQCRTCARCSPSRSRPKSPLKSRQTEWT